MLTLHLKLAGNTGAAMASDIALAGELWGVNLGTTSKTAGYADSVLVVATATRVAALSQYICDNEGVVEAYAIRDEASFSSMSEEDQTYYLLGVANT